MKRYLLLLVLFSFTLTVYCQQITFQKTYGGIYSDEGFSVQQTTDGGYIISGILRGTASGNVKSYLIKTDSLGDTLWTKIFQTTVDYAYAVQQTSDGGFIVAGNIASAGGGLINLIKANSNGDTLWINHYGDIGVNGGRAVKQTNDGAYIITGNTSSGAGTGLNNVSLLKVDGSGNIIWSESFGGVHSDFGYSVQQTSDSGYIIVGKTNSFGGTSNYDDIYLIKTDTTGNMQWSKTYGGANDDYGNAVQQTFDGGYIIAASTSSFGSGGYDAYVIKCNSNGDTLWSRTYGSIYDDYLNSVQQTSDSGYILTGQAGYLGTNNYSFFLIKIDANGDTIWAEIFEGYAGNSVMATTDGGFVSVGSRVTFAPNDVNVYMIKTDSIGHTGCNESNAIFFITSPSTIVTNPITNSISGGMMQYKYGANVGYGGTVSSPCSSVSINEITKDNTFIVSPNPFTSEFAISSSEKINQIIIYDLMGATVFQQELPSNKTSAELNLSFLPQGVYFLNVKANGESWTRKIVKM